MDINLLRVLDALLEERSATRAGEKLGLTQSTVSHSLSRLRGLLDDELFVRGPEGLQPTPRATQIGPRLRMALNQLQLALLPLEFTPHASNRRFTVACTSYLCRTLLPEIVTQLREVAPKIQLNIEFVDARTMNGIRAGHIDLAIGAFSHTDESYMSEVLLEESLVWVVRKDHKTVGWPLTIEKLASVPHVVASTVSVPHDTDGIAVENEVERQLSNDRLNLFGKSLLEKGLTSIGQMSVPDSECALAIVERSEAAALVPRRLASAYAKRHPIKFFSPPYQSPAIPVSMLWDGMVGMDPSLVWLRAFIHKVVDRESSAESGEGSLG